MIFHSQELKGKWTQPEAINLFSPDSIAHAIDMTITPDGKTMYFLGVNHQGVIENKPPDIYKSERIDGIWQPASKVDHPISTDEFIESYPIVVSDGSIFFTSNRTGGYGGRDIYRAQYLGEGKFEEPLNLGAPINTSFNEGTTYVTPDESYLIKTASKEDSKQGFYMSRFQNNQWQKLEYIDFGLSFEEGWVYFCPYVLPDGKTLVYSRRYNNPNDKSWNGVEKGEVYWVDISDYILDND